MHGRRGIELFGFPGVSAAGARVPSRRVVLLGVGHTHAEIVRRWAEGPPAGAQLTCVSDAPVATYSGMLPGVLAGQYPQQLMRTDLPRLCAAAGAGLVVGNARGLDLRARLLQFADRPPVPFDVLSIGIGSVPAFEGIAVGDATALVPIKPMRSLLDRLDASARRAASVRRPLPVRVAVVGGGAGGVELALTAPAHLRARLGASTDIEMTIVEAAAELMPGSPASTRRRVGRALGRGRGVRQIAGHRVVGIDAEHLTLDDGSAVGADIVLWATGATGPPLLAALGLPIDARGFLLTGNTLQSVAGEPIFAVGDTGTIAGAGAPKAGVYAVRQAPVLWENIARVLDGRPLRRYAPQRHSLRLINTGDGRAIGEWRGLSFEGRWCWRLKDAIDRRFMARYQALARRAGEARDS